MNESKERNSAEEVGLSLNARSSVGEHEPLNITDSSVMMAERDSCISSALEEGQEEVKDKLINNFECSTDLKKQESVNAENISHYEEEPLNEGEISDGDGTASLKVVNMADGFDNKHSKNEEGNSDSATEKHNLYEELKILEEGNSISATEKHNLYEELKIIEEGISISATEKQIDKEFEILEEGISILAAEKQNLDEELKILEEDNSISATEKRNLYEELKILEEGNSILAAEKQNLDEELKILEEGNSISATEKHNLYEELKILGECKIVENKDDFKCEFCLNVCEPKAGIILTECIHSFCKECIKKIVETSNDVEIKCPFRDLDFSCDTILPHRIIKEICGAVTFEKFLDRSLSVACCSEDNPMPIEKVEKRVIDTALYEELVVLDDQLLVENQDAFICEVCLMTCEPKAGAIIAECLHAFCKQCIATLVNMTNDVEIHCPYRDNDYSCEKVIQHRELKQIVCQEVFDKFLEKSVSIAMRRMSDIRNCQFPDCKGLIFIDEMDGNDTFTCPVCERINCVLCKGLHDPRVLSCEQYEKTLKNPNQFSETFLRDMVNTREAMLCPGCGVVIKKVDGCDGITCSQCKTEICWATRGPRWGPRGNGDTSGGCQCKMYGRKCHPDCRNCH